MVDELVTTIAESTMREVVIGMLFNVPGLPPIIQSIHIVCVAIIVATVGFTHLRILGLAFAAQDISTMLKRSTPYFYWTLLLAAISGLPLIIARPDRYFYNPIAQAKFMLLFGCLAVTTILIWKNRKIVDYWTNTTGTLWAARCLALLGLLGWIAIIFAGRWIAYVDYLYW